MKDTKLPMQTQAAHKPRGETPAEPTEDRAACVAALKWAVNEGSYRIRTKDLAMDIVDSLIHSLD